eukprot:TRINITY_DN4661_c0_g1_i2.p1 TRINITY_DN4661_c0_g1~~TRINITY_DN4661_c0_g1_i2.p1  ORF type:complete len:111 (-),score=14.72 TRINITY_DN4661_c0_g1_i2:488-820(-)
MCLLFWGIFLLLFSAPTFFFSFPFSGLELVEQKGEEEVPKCAWCACLWTKNALLTGRIIFVMSSLLSFILHKNYPSRQKGVLCPQTRTPRTLGDFLFSFLLHQFQTREGE